MRDPPKGVYPLRKKFRAGVWREGKWKFGPACAEVSEAEKDLLALRKGQTPSREQSRALPKFDYRHYGFKKGYRAMRHIGDVVVAGPLRATAQEASVDATGFAKATTSRALEKLKNQIAQ